MKTTFNTIKKFWPIADKGFDDKNPVFYGHGKFPIETPAHEIIDMRYTGWFTNEDGETFKDGSGLCVGTVFKLPSRPGYPEGVFMAGYVWGDNDERVIFPDIFANPKECAYRADGHAEKFAEERREDNAKANEAWRLSNKKEEKENRLRECLALRHKKCMSYVRDEALRIVEQIREINKTLSEDYADYV